MKIHVSDVINKTSFITTVSRVPCLHEMIEIRDKIYVVRNVIHLGDTKRTYVASIGVITSNMQLNLPK